MDARLRVTVKGLSRLNHRLDGLLQRLRDPSPALDAASQYMVRSIKNRIYQTKTDPEGERWEELAERTIRIREAQGYDPDNILVMSGRLGRSVHVESSGATRATIVADPVDRKGRSYAGYHQEGTDRMPARQFMGFSETNADRIARIVNRYVHGQSMGDIGDE